jgi:hypothetical protein
MVWEQVFSPPYIYLLLAYFGIAIFAARFWIKDAKRAAQDHHELTEARDKWRK